MESTFVDQGRKKGETMGHNELLNANWTVIESDNPKYYQLDQKIHFDHATMANARVCSLQLGQDDIARFSYIPPILTKKAEEVTIGLFIRGNDLSVIKYTVMFWDEAQNEMRQWTHNVAPEVKMEFKKICVTYKIPLKATSMKVQWEFRGINTGLTFFRPSVQLK